MASVNKFIGIGNIGRLETRYLSSGDPVSNFSLAINESWKGKDGEKQERTEWVNCVAYKKLAEIIEKYCSVGQSVYIEGRIQTRKWQDKDGQDKYTTEIVADRMQMLGGKRDSELEESRSEKPSGGAPSGGFSDFPDDIPFASSFVADDPIWKRLK